jgi:hypothetical protein
MATFEAKHVNAPAWHKTQDFEMLGGDHVPRHDGWTASARVVRLPSDIAGSVPKIRPAWQPLPLPG